MLKDGVGHFSEPWRGLRRGTHGMYDTARQRAEIYAPAPKHEPIIAGMAGMMIATVVVFVFLILSGLDLEDFRRAAASTIVIGFLLPFAYFKHQERRHDAAFARELQWLRREAETASTADTSPHA